mgnify:CR=1 FL=1
MDTAYKFTPFNDIKFYDLVFGNTADTRQVFFLSVMFKKVFLINFVFVHDTYILGINFSALPARAFLFNSLLHYFLWRGGCVYVYPYTTPPPPFPALRQFISCILGPYLQMSKVTF